MPYKPSSSKVWNSFPYLCACVLINLSNLFKYSGHPSCFLFAAFSLMGKEWKSEQMCSWSVAVMIFWSVIIVDLVAIGDLMQFMTSAISLINFLARILDLRFQQLYHICLNMEQIFYKLWASLMVCP